MPPRMSSIRTTTPLCSTSRRWNRWWPARRWCGRWRNWSRRRNSARPSSSVTTRRRCVPRFGAATADWRSPGRPRRRPSPSIDAAASIRVGFAELPGAKQVYHPKNRTWETRPPDADTRVTLMSISGRVGVVWAGAEHADAAFRLLGWLSSQGSSGAVCAASGATTLFRRSQIASPQNWVEKAASASAALGYVAVVEGALSRPQRLSGLRFPGCAESLHALDEAVHTAVEGRESPIKALEKVAGHWREITERLGVERQKAAYAAQFESGLAPIPFNGATVLARLTAIPFNGATVLARLTAWRLDAYARCAV